MMNLEKVDLDQIRKDFVQHAKGFRNLINGNNSKIFHLESDGGDLEILFIIFLFPYPSCTCALRCTQDGDQNYYLI